jgi:hypothetical protein
VTQSGSQPATYVFCLVQSARAPSLRGVPESIPGAGAPRVIPVDRGMWAVVADAPLGRFFFRRSPVIPLKLFTLFSADARARAQLLARRARLQRLFADLRGLEEWGVRIIAGEAELRAPTPLVSGRDYLQSRKRLMDQGGKPSRAVVREANRALKTLERLASEVRKEVFPPAGAGRPFVTGASFLVKAKRRNQWQKQAARLADSLARHGHHLQVSGPWPPYHFVSK